MNGKEPIPGALVYLQVVDDFTGLVPQEQVKTTFPINFGPDITERGCMEQLERGVRIFPQHLQQNIISEIIRVAGEPLKILFMMQQEKTALITIKFKVLDFESLPDLNPDDIG